MNDRTARIATLFGLAALIAWSYPVSAYTLGSLLGGGLKWATIFASFVMCVCTLRLWRRYVRWNAKRAVWTASATALLALQLVIWLPLWSMPGCGSTDELLLFGQSSTLAGVWCAACGLIWWLDVLTGRRAPRSADSAETSWHMTPNTARLAIGLALMPLLPGVFFVSALAALNLLNLKEAWACFWAYALCAALTVVTWLTLFRAAVDWDRRRKRLTGCLAGVLMLSPAGVFLPDLPGGPFAEAWKMAHWLLPLFAASLWFIGTARLWRRAGDARAFRQADDVDPALPCPQCGYSLVGLREVRCPECGWASTLDDFVKRCLVDAAD